MARGEFLAAADQGADALGTDPADADLELGWLTGLALARCGAIERAEELVAEADLVGRADGAEPRLQEDILALRARLVKDRALAASGDERRSEAQRAAAAYGSVAERTDSSYALVNSATMYLIAGDPAASVAAATRALDQLAEADDDYWNAASRAEALLLLGRIDEAGAALATAGDAEPDWSMRSTTIRQLRLVCREADIDAAILDALPMPSVVHYSGHMFAQGPEDDLRSQIEAIFENEQVGAVHGSLACGSDLLVVEAAIERGIEVHAVLPCPAPAFVARSVTPGGGDWPGRFDAALESATSVVIEPTVAVPDESMFGYADQLAMGFALAQATQLGSHAFQLALWDGVTSDGEAGTAAAVARWGRTGNPTTVINLPREALTPVASRPKPKPPGGSGHTPARRERTVKAMLFADVKGFSALGEDELPDFFETVMARLARVVDSFGDTVRYRNTWGDAVYLVIDTAGDAARISLAMQAELLGARDELGWPTLTARIGGHAGPVFAGHDHVTDEATFYGTHVTRAARIEPRTPPGEVFVTENFAALVALEGDAAIRLEYVGHVPTAKDYGAFPMYVLRH